MKITREWLDSNRTSRGGWNACQLRILGLPWPPKKGWLDVILGSEISSEVALEFELAAKETKGERRARRREERRIKRAARKDKRFRPNAYPFVQVNNTTVTVESKSFLNSYEWRKIRMEALKKYGARCQCCGATPTDGVKMNVDHIKPRRLFPELALTLDNLQILCEECNHGKGNWDMTDWRVKFEDD